jgi:hypothetical protein
METPLEVPMKIITALIAVILLAVISPATAQIITDRPDFADATVPVPVGVLQVESGYLFAKTPGAEQHTAGQFLVKTGLSEGMEIRFGLDSYERVSNPLGDTDGLSDGSLGVKFRLLRAKEDAGPGAFNLSTIVFAGIPTGGDNFRAAHLSPGVMLTSDLALPSSWTWAPFVQYTFTEDGAGQYNELSAGFSFVHPLGGKVSWFTEYYATLAEDTFREDKHFLGTGFAWLLSDAVQLDCYGGSALNGETPDYYIGAGLSFRLSMVK